MSMFSVDRSVHGIAKEAVDGTYVAPVAFVPLDKFDPKRVITQLEDKGRRGSAAARYGQTQGVWRTEIDIEGDVHPDTFAWALAAVLGDVTTTGGGAPFSHAMSLLNSGTMQPKSYSWTDQYGVAVRGYVGNRCHDLSLKFNADGKLTFTSKWTGKSDATQSAPSPSFSSVELMPGWRCVPTIAGASVNLLDATLDFKREVDPVNVANNAQDPLAVFLGSLDVTGKVTLVMSDETYHTKYLTNVQDAIVLDFQQGAGAALTEVKLQLSKAGLKEDDIDRGGQYVKLGLSIDALANSTDAGASGGMSPVKATIQNALASGTYV